MTMATWKHKRVRAYSKPLSCCHLSVYPSAGCSSAEPAFVSPDEKNWPKDIVYDPEGDGIKLTSLGVYEHRNNPIDKQYSCDLKTGDGIDLYTIDIPSTSVNKENRQVGGDFNLYQNYPNPFNPSTNIRYELKSDTTIELNIFNTLGQKVKILINAHQY